MSIETGPRDRVFFAAGWSAPHNDGVPVRVSVSERATVRFPLPARRDYNVVVRLDPIAPDVQRRMTVLLNRQLVGAVYLRSDPARMGAYRLRLPGEQVRVGMNELTIIPDTLVTMASAGPKFEWLDPGARPGVRLWYRARARGTESVDLEDSEHSGTSGLGIRDSGLGIWGSGLGTEPAAPELPRPSRAKAGSFRLQAEDSRELKAES